MSDLADDRLQPTTAPKRRVITSSRSAPAFQPLIGLPPVVDGRCRLLVLGSFPGLASLQAQQYYAHPRNQFWPIVGALFGVDLCRLPYAQRLEFVREQGLGIWDVYASCRRAGSADSAIADTVLNDLPALVRRLPALRLIAHNGGESARHMRRSRDLGVQALRLPSTSPANASWSLQRKLAAWAEAFARAGLPVRWTADTPTAR